MQLWSESTACWGLLKEELLLTGNKPNKQAGLELGHIASQVWDSRRDQKYNFLDSKGVLQVRYTRHSHPFPHSATDLLHYFEQMTSHSSALHLKQDEYLQQLQSAWK